MEEAHARYRCLGDDGSSVIVIEYRYTDRADGMRGSRLYPGGQRLALGTGEAVRYIDPETFEVIESGELLHRC